MAYMLLQDVMNYEWHDFTGPAILAEGRAWKEALGLATRRASLIGCNAAMDGCGEGRKGWSMALWYLMCVCIFPYKYHETSKKSNMVN